MADDPPAALVVGAPTVRCPNARIHEIGTALLSIAAKMAAKLG